MVEIGEDDSVGHDNVAYEASESNENTVAVEIAGHNDPVEYAEVSESAGQNIRYEEEVVPMLRRRRHIGINQSH